MNPSLPCFTSCDLYPAKERGIASAKELKLGSFKFRDNKSLTNFINSSFEELFNLSSDSLLFNKKEVARSITFWFIIIIIIQI